MEITALLVLQYALLIETAALVLFILVIPSSGWTRIKAKIKKTGAIVTVCTDDGFEKDYVMKADLDHGIFSGKKDALVFTPEPKFVETEVEVINDDGTTRKETKTMLDITTDSKKTIDEAIQHRSFTDTGLPHYTGLASKGIAVTPRLLALIKEVNTKVDEERIRFFKLVEPHILKSYIRATFSQQTIENIKFAAEQRGYLRKPLSDNLKKFAIPIMLILVVGVAIWAVLSGYIDLSAYGIGVSKVIPT